MSIRLRRGFGLLVVVILLSIVALVGAAVASRTRSILQTGQSESLQARANDTAYSGLQATLAAVERGETSWSLLSARTALPTHQELAYELRITDNLSNDTVMTDADGTEIPPESLYVKSLAFVDGSLRAGASCVVAQERGATFNYPAFGSDFISADNSLVEAVDASGNIIAGDGHIRTNGTQTDAISLSGGTFVDGDVTVGPGGDPVTAIGVESGSGFSGDSQRAGAELPLPDVAAGYSDSGPDAQFFNIPLPIPLPGLQFLNLIGVGSVSPGTYNRMVIEPTSNLVLQPSMTGSTETMVNILYLAPGDYYVNELGSTGPVAIFIPQGEVRIHVRDTVNMDAGGTSISTDAVQAFQVYVTEDASSTSIARTDGNLVLATQGDMTVTDSQLQGALYGKTVEVANSQLRYPKELDGMALNDKVRGSWNQFGLRLLGPRELDTYR